MTRENELSKIILDSAIEVHRQLGPGLLESAYEACLCFELARRNLSFEKQKPVPVLYKGVNLDCAFRIDILVERLVIIELKAIESIQPIHLTQVLTYLKLTSCKLGLIINFNVPRLSTGFKRVALNL